MMKWDTNNKNSSVNDQDLKFEISSDSWDSFCSGDEAEKQIKFELKAN